MKNFHLTPLTFIAFAVMLCAGCVQNETKVTMLQAPEVEGAAKFKSISIAQFSGQYGDAISKALEADLTNAKIHAKPVYHSVRKAGDSRSLGMDVRRIATQAQSLDTEAMFVGEVTNAGFNDTKRSSTEYVCDQKKDPKKLFSACKSGHNKTVNCKDRVASMTVLVKLVDATNKSIAYSESISKSNTATGCGDEQIQDGSQMLRSLTTEIVAHVKRKIIPHDSVVSIELMGADAKIGSGVSLAQFSGAIKFAKEGRMDRACEAFRELYESEKGSVALNYNLGLCEESASAYWRASEYYKIADQLTTEPNKLITAALLRSEANIKKGGDLSKNRPDIVNPGKIEEGASPQTYTNKRSTSSSESSNQSSPLNITSETMSLDKRTALVIGNSKYRKGSLRNPVNDARLIADELRKSNFEVIKIEDADAATMNAAIEQYGRAIKQGGVSLVFYAGHGMQVAGENFLLPVDADIKQESEVSYKAINLGYILSKLEDAKSRVNIVILDACRDNPFARSWRSTKGGLASIDAPAGTVIAFATAPGKTAADGAGQNGLFTSRFVKQLKTPNLKIEDVLKNTRKDVVLDSNSTQVPWDSSSLTGDFYFKVNGINGDSEVNVSNKDDSNNVSPNANANTSVKKSKKR